MTVMAAQFLFVILLLPASLMAQAGVTVSGIVEDQSRAPIPGAQVSLVQGETARTTSTDAQGRFMFTGVAPGKYKLGAAAHSFQPQELEIGIGAQSLESLKLRLKISAQATQVTVSADSLDDSADAESNADSVKFDDDLFRQLPVPARDVLPLITKFVSPAALGTEGLSIVTDGIEGNQLDVPASAIRKVNINRNPYSAEFRRPGKGRVEVTTQRGRRKFHGSLAVFARNSVFDARNAFAQSTPDLDRRMVVATLGGPLGRKRSLFFLTGEHLTNNESEIVNAITPAGPFRAIVPSPQRRDRFLARIDLRRMGIHYVSASYGITDDSRRNRNVGDFNLPEQGIRERSRQHRLLLTERAILSANLINDLRFAFKSEDAISGNPAPGPTIVVADAFTGGPSPTFSHDGRKSFDALDSVSYVRGRQTFRFGIQSRVRLNHAIDASNFNGTFQFASLQNFAAATPFVYQANQGRPDARFSVYDASGFVQDDIRVSPQLSLACGLRYDWQSSIDKRKNLAPRFGFAFAPGKHKTVLRGGIGIFYEDLPTAATLHSLLIDGVRTREVVISNPSFPDPFQGGQVILTPPSVIRVAPDIRSPYIVQTSLGVERELSSRTWLSLEYSFLRGLHLFRSRNVNAPEPETGLRPAAGFLNINQVESGASLRSHALGVTFRGRAGKHLRGIAQYTLSRSFNDTSGAFSLPADNFNLRAEWGRADFNQTHRFNFAGTLELPRGLRLASVLSLASGAPFNITTGFDDNHDTVANDRPPGVTRNTELRPGTVDLDVRLTKTFKLAPPFLGGQPPAKRESHNLEFSVDAFNAINHTNFAHIVGTQSSPFFGRATSAFAARTIQFSLNYIF